MATQKINPTPWWFWVIAVLAILWNSGGVMDFTMTHTANEAYMANFTEAQRNYFYSFPLWANIAWAVGVFGAFLGSVLLALRSRFAWHLFVASFAGMVISFAYQFMSHAPASLYSAGAIAFTIAIWVVALLLVWFANKMRQRTILR